MAVLNAHCLCLVGGIATRCLEILDLLFWVMLLCCFVSLEELALVFPVSEVSASELELVLMVAEAAVLLDLAWHEIVSLVVEEDEKWVEEV